MALPPVTAIRDDFATETFSQLFDPPALQTAFQEHFANSRSKGVDRLSGRQYESRFASEVGTISLKCLSSAFRFSPYLEMLKPRGRGREPRLISIPTIRDRVVLHQLNQFLAQIFPDSVSHNIASVYVREISRDLARKDPRTTFVCGCDIKTFYDSIQRQRLMRVIGQRLRHRPALSLIAHAIATPTVTKSTRRTNYREHVAARGIPQGLAISNILAAIALRDVDAGMKALPITYYRYVDDILVYGAELDVRRAQRSLLARLRTRGLSAHPIGKGKSHLGMLTNTFGYLGYQFEWPKVSIRQSTIERLLQTLASKFSEFIHQTDDRLRMEPSLSRPQLQNAFVLELNEKITGSVSRNRKYGWIAYFNEITDLTLLHKLDHAVARMFERIPDFEYSASTNLKKFSRAYFEMKFRLDGGYIQNYDRITTIAEMKDFLIQRGRLASDADPSDDVIAQQYDIYRRRILRSMLADEGAPY